MTNNNEVDIEAVQDFDTWMRQGIINGWCGPAVCYTHDGLPMSDEENEEFQEGDPCIHILRLYSDEEHKKAIESEHSPSQWRNHYHPSSDENIQKKDDKNVSDEF